MGSPVYQTETEENDLVKKNKLARAKSIKDAKEKEALLKPAESVAIGKLQRKEDFEKNKQQIKDTRDAEIKRLNDEKEKRLSSVVNNKEGAKKAYDDADERKLARITKRADMRALRDKERGAIREDRANQRITKLANRNNMSIKEATKHYNNRMEELGRFHKGEREDPQTKFNPNTKTEDIINFFGKGQNTTARFNDDPNVETSLEGNEPDPTTSDMADTALGFNIKDYTKQDRRGYDWNPYD